MKKGAKPEVSQKWWKKNKARTLRSSTLTEALGAYEEKREEVYKSPTSKGFDELTEMLKNIVLAAKNTEDECDENRHAQTLECIKKYPGAVAKEAGIVQKKMADYKDLIKKWEDKKKTCLSGIKEIEKRYLKLLQEAEDLLLIAPTAQTTVEEAPANFARQVRNMKQQLDAIRNESIEMIQIVRIPGNASEEPHSDDKSRTIMAMGTEAMRIHTIYEGKYHEMIKRLDQATRN